MHLNATSRSLRFPRGFVPLDDASPDVVSYEDIIGRSGALRNVLTEIQQVAPTDASVLIYGETGTGKERFARAVHNLSGRRGQAFVKCNCAAIPTPLIESELFDAANGGTLFLDDIGEAPLDLQRSLLGVLQQREFECVGTRRSTGRVRLVAATNADLRDMVHTKRFRADLFYRLNVFPIHLPPLRNRREDIPSLLAHFARACAKRMGRRVTRVSASTMDTLLAYSWPGNIRELHTLVERAVVLSSGDVLEVPLAEIDDALRLEKLGIGRPAGSR